MRTAHTIKIAYTAADMLGKADGLTYREDDGLVEVVREDETGRNTYEWVVWVNTAARRQRAWLYIPRTGHQRAISQHDAQAIILGVVPAV
jgi:phage baseplate assembly protein gpV